MPPRTSCVPLLTASILSLGALATREFGQIRFEAFVVDDKGARHAVVHGASPDEVVSEARKELGL